MRTKGATSHIFVSLAELNAKFKPDAIIPIARRFADLNGLNGKAAFATTETMVAAGNQPALEEKIQLVESVEPQEEQ